jgi:tripartite ATP-independent transporter DctP family solute receptor
MPVQQTPPSRRRVLAAAVAGAAALTAAPVLRAQQARTWRLGHQYNVDHPMSLGALEAARVLAQNSNGRLRIDVFPAGQLGTGKELVQQVSDDSLDFTIDGPGQFGLWQRPLTIFEIPFVARDWNHLVKMMESDWAMAQFKALADNKNLRRIGSPWYYGSRHFTTNKVALRTAADARGLKIRVPESPLYMDMIRALNAAPTPMALAEVYLSLQTGVADGQENPLPTINSNKFFEVQKFLNLTAHIVNPMVPLMSEKTWKALPPADQKIVTEAFEAGGVAATTTLRALEVKLVGDLKGKGMTVVESDRESFRAAMKSVYAKNETVWGTGVLEQLQATK